MNIINEDSKRTLYSGIFWIVDLIDVYKNKDYCFTFEVDSNGNSITDVELILKMAEHIITKECGVCCRLK